jgi:hypothetical protein
MWAENQLIYHLYFNDRHYYCKPVKNILYAIYWCCVLFCCCQAMPDQSSIFHLLFLSSSLFLIFFIEKIYRNKYGWYQFCRISFIYFAVACYFFSFRPNSYNGLSEKYCCIFISIIWSTCFYLNKATEYDWIYWKRTLTKAIFVDNPNFFRHHSALSKRVSLRMFLLNCKNYLIEIFAKKHLCYFSHIFSGMNKLYIGGSFMVFYFLHIVTAKTEPSVKNFITC